MGFIVIQRKESLSQVVPAKLNLSRPLDNKLSSYITITSVEGKILPVRILPPFCWEPGLVLIRFYRGGVSHLKLSGMPKLREGAEFRVL